MNKNILSLILTLAILLATITARAELLVQADRSQLSLDETLTLTITKDGRGSIDDAALQPLTNDFRVLGRSQSSSTQIINGSMSSSFTLTMELAPKRAGVLLIPALVSGSDTSKPLTIRVDTQAQPTTRADNAAIFIETTVDKPTVLVQEQAVYTLRIYTSVQARIGEPEPPQLRDAMLEKLDDAKFAKVVNGKTYQVFERKYAIFPQKSGVLEIPPTLVQAVVAGRQRPDPFGGFFAQSGEEVRLRGKAERITVREKPPGYPAGAAWLPTSGLTVSADFSGDLQALRVGEPLNMNIAVTGPGLLGAQLPTMTLPGIEGLKVYQDKALVENLKKDGGITGSRKVSFALIPTRPGTIMLPEVRIPWWDKGQHRVAYAVLPSRRLEVKGGALAAAPGAGAVNLPPPISPSAISDSPAEAAVSPAETASRLPLILLVSAVVLVLGGWMVTLYLLIQARRQLAAQAATRRQAGEAETKREREAFSNLTKACRDDDPNRARLALLNWVKLRYPREVARTAADLERIFPGAELGKQLAEIDQALYGHSQSNWQGAELLAAVEKARKCGGAGAGKDSALPPLYQA